MFKKGIIRDNYVFTIETKQKTYIVEYPRASIEEMIEYYIDPEDKFVFLYKFLTKYTKKVIKKRFWYKKQLSKMEFLEIGPDYLKQILDKITETRFFVPQMRSSASDTSNPPFESFIAFLSEKLNVPPHILLKEYTLEQAILLSRGVEYNINMGTEEGKIRNKMNESWETMFDSSPEDDLERVLKARELRRKNSNS